MRILIASGIYPPDIGGPAQYARNLFETWRAQGHDVKVAAYRWERAFPPLFRHLLYLSKIIRKGWRADLILVLDTWSAAVPTMVACKMMGKKYIIRVNKDHLWESYVERTGKDVLLRDFYDTKRALLFKEKLLFKLAGSVMRKASAVVFSSNWHKDIFKRVYKLDDEKIFLVGDYCGAREEPKEPENRTFIAGSRSVRYKNSELLSEAFDEASAEVKKRGLPEISIDRGKAVYDSFFEKIHRSYAVVLASLSEVSPATIFDAIRAGVPFIVTKENGVNDLIKEGAIYIDPLDRSSVKEAIIWLSDPQNREVQAKKVRSIRYMKSWQDIARDLAEINSKIHGKK